MVIQGRHPKVSVCVITYNHENCIRECLNSIVDQKTDFDFELIVGEDCSTDRTRAIIQEFADRYPGIVKPIYQEKNIDGGVHNFLTVHRAAVGDYIAHVDGDDYCLPGKLQAQADLLDNDPQCNIAFHRMMIMTPCGELREGPFFDMKNIGDLCLNQASIIQFMAIGLHSSKMYRKTVRDFETPDFDIIDYYVNVEQVRDGYARFVGHDNFGVYRMGAGIASSGSRSREAMAACFLHFYRKYPKYHLQVNTAALTYFVADLKNRRNTWPMFFSIWVKTFHVGSVMNLLHNIKFIKQLRLVR